MARKYERRFEQNFQLKTISQEERQARAQLKKMGVSEYELQRLYDANYKARQRFAFARQGNYAEVERLKLSWEKTLRGAQAARREGKSVSEYIKARTQTYKKTYTTKYTKQSKIESVVGEVYKGSTGFWANDAVGLRLERLSAEKVVQVYTDAYNAAGITAEEESETYRRAHNRYIVENCSTQGEWDRILQEEKGKTLEANANFLTAVASVLDPPVDIAGLNAAQNAAQGLTGAEYEKARRTAFRQYAGL